MNRRRQGGRDGAARWCRVGAVLLALGIGLGAADAPEPVPTSLGQGTGGDGVWSCSAAAHSPTTVTVDATAGPAATPAAVVAFRFSATKYNWNWATVRTGTVDLSRFKAVRLTYRTDVPAGFPRLSVMLRESTGAAYWVPQTLPLASGRFRTEAVPFDRFTVPGWSKDANGKLDLGLVAEVSVGLETGLGGSGRLLVSDVELVPAGW